MSWAKYVLVSFLMLDLGVNLALHGQTRAGTYNFWVMLGATIITLTLYNYAGVFNENLN